MISKGPQRREGAMDAPPTAGSVRPEEGSMPTNCPKCSSALPSGGAWCPACGLQVVDICGACGGALAAAWSFCPRCGSSAGEPGTIPCPSCREPVSLGFTFCTRCGSQARPLCNNCGRPQRREWTFCPTCGAGRGPTPPSPRPPVPNPEAESFNEKGKRAYEVDDLDAASAAFQQAVALDPMNADYQTNLAVTLDERDMDSEAFAAYQRALELNPRQVTALLNVGYLYSESERFEEARQVWELVIRVDPASEEAQEARNNLRNLDEL